MAEVKELKARLVQDSKTSHKPPSQDRGWKSKSERIKGLKSSGGQLGHKGKTLKMAQHADEVVKVPLTGECSCGTNWDKVPAIDQLARQVHDLPEIKLQVTEYQAEVKVCPHCQQRSQAKFPEHVKGQVQYGPRVHGLATYLNVAHFIPLERTCDILEAVCGARPSEGTLVLNLQVAHERLAGFEKSLQAALLKEQVLHADETGSKVNGKLEWLHVISSAKYTLYGHHPQRGINALNSMAVLPQFNGTIMHDAWGSYFNLPAKHALCNAHLLRELRFLAEEQKQEWAGDLRTALQGIYHRHKTATLPGEDKVAFLKHFDQLTEEGLTANPCAEPVAKQRGRVKQSPARNVALRCQKHKQAYLRFLEDSLIPFDNNQAERDIRMVCVKRKVSGGFRSPQGAAIFCRIRSYISTLQKHSLNPFYGLVSLFTSAHILLPTF
jgi:transposase